MLKDLSYPVKLKDIPEIENRLNISINVYVCKKTIQFFILHHTKTKDHVNLLYMKEENKTRYCWIKDELTT